MKGAIVVVFLLVTGAVAQDQPSLAEIAKQKPLRKATRVITNDDIPSVPIPAVEKVPETAAPADKEKLASETASADSDAPANVRDAEKKLADLRTELAKTEEEVQSLTQRIPDANDDVVKSALQDQLDLKKQAVEDLKKRVPEAEAQVAEAKKATGGSSEASPEQ
jgi:hypothetical protein